MSGVMLLFRSLAVGLAGACLLLLVYRPAYDVRIEHAQVQGPPASVVPTIVDVAAGVPAGELSSLIRLAPGERVVAVDDHPVATDLEAGAAIVDREASPGTFVDLEVAGAAGHRRVLVLLH